MAGKRKNNQEGRQVEIAEIKTTPPNDHAEVLSPGAKQKFSFQKKRNWKEYFLLRMNPDNDDCSIKERSLRSGVGYGTACALERDEEFQNYVRLERFKHFSGHLMKIDEATLRTAMQHSDMNSQVNAAKLIYSRFDPDFKERKQIDINITLTDLYERLASQ